MFPNKYCTVHPETTPKVGNDTIRHIMKKNILINQKDIQTILKHAGYDIPSLENKISQSLKLANQIPKGVWQDFKVY